MVWVLGGNGCRILHRKVVEGKLEGYQESDGMIRMVNINFFYFERLSICVNLVFLMAVIHAS